MTPPRDFNPNDPCCPKCGGGMWDNRDDKASDRSPDFKCKGDNGECDGKVWMAPPPGRGGNNRNGNGRGGRGGGSNGGGNNRPQGNQQQAAPAPRMDVPALTPIERKAHRDKAVVTYFSLMAKAADHMQKIAAERGILLTMDDVHAATYSLYSLMDRKKILEPPALTGTTTGGAPAKSAPPSSSGRVPARAAAGDRSTTSAPRAMAGVAAGDGRTEDDLGSDNDDDLPF